MFIYALTCCLKERVMEEMSGEVQVCSAYHKPGQVGSMVEPVCHLHSNNVVSFCRWKKRYILLAKTRITASLGIKLYCTITWYSLPLSWDDLIWASPHQTVPNTDFCFCVARLHSLLLKENFFFQMICIDVKVI